MNFAARTFALAFAAALAFTTDAEAKETSLKVDQTKSYRVRKQMHIRPTIEVENSRTVKAWFSRNRLFIRGLRQGETTVRFSGEYRRYQAGNAPLMRGVPFEHVLTVTVAGHKRPVERFKSISIKLKQGQTRIWRTKTFFGRYRGLTNMRRSAVVRVRIGHHNRKPSIALKGTRPGRTILRLKCQRWDSRRGEWINYTVYLKVRVVRRR